MKEAKIFNDYSITDEGDVYSYKKGSIYKMVGGYISRSRKYRAVYLTINGIARTCYIHRLVAEAFIPNPNNYPQINHIDGNPLNNHVSNLEWCTPSQNIKHAYDTGLFTEIEQKPCLRCKKDYCGGKKLSLCKECRQEILRQWEVEYRKKQFDEKYEDVFSNNEKFNAMLALKRAGFTQVQIGEIFGVSKQRVHQILEKCIEKHMPI